MRSIFILFCLLAIPFTAKATQIVSTNLINCLAKEEEFYHKKKLINPNYELNQKLIGELIQLKDVYPIADLSHEICATQNNPGFFTAPSVRLLAALSKHQGGFFTYSDQLSKIERGLAESHIKDFISEIPDYFFQYLSAVQSTLPTPDCLEKGIPAIKELNQQMKYLGTELNHFELIKTYSEKIFKGLANIEKIKKKCEELKARQIKKSVKQN